MVDDQAHLAKVADAVGAAVTVVMLLLSFVADADLLKDWPFACFDSFLVLFLKTRGKGVDPQLLGSKLHPFVASERPYVGELQLLVEKAAEGGLGVPAVEGDRQVECRVFGNPILEHHFGQRQLALVKRSDFR